MPGGWGPGPGGLRIEEDTRLSPGVSPLPRPSHRGGTGRRRSSRSPKETLTMGKSVARTCPIPDEGSGAAHQGIRQKGPARCRIRPPPAPNAAPAPRPGRNGPHGPSRRRPQLPLRSEEGALRPHSNQSRVSRTLRCPSAGGDRWTTALSAASGQAVPLNTEIVPGSARWRWSQLRTTPSGPSSELPAFPRRDRSTSPSSSHSVQGPMTLTTARARTRST